MAGYSRASDHPGTCRLAALWCAFMLKLLGKAGKALAGAFGWARTFQRQLAADFGAGERWLYRVPVIFR
jgi:hypothetical protein